MINDLAVDDVEDVEEVDEMDDGEAETAEENDGAEESTDNVGDPSVEINVEALISELESEGLTKKLGSGLDARKRLEELMERKRAMRELEDFEDYVF